MNRIKRLKLEGFRRLESVDLPVRPLMVLIGANGVGKTSLLDAVTLISASAGGNLTSTLSRLGGISSVVTRDRASEVSLAVEMEVPGHHPLEYDLSIRVSGTGHALSRETLRQDRGHASAFKHIDSSDAGIRYYDVRPGHKGGLIKPDWDYNSFETSLSQVPRMFREPEELRKVLSTATSYHALDVGPRAPVKLPQPMKPANLPGSDGEDLIPYLYYLRETDPNRFEMITDSLHAAFPDFESLSFPPVAAGVMAIAWKDRKFSKPMYMHELSEGTLRFMWLVALLHSPSLSTITMIDEPEVSLHPELLSLLAELMREASMRTQLIVATHSDRFIRFLKPNEVVVMDVTETGATTATWADEMDLSAWLADYSLDEIWSMGLLGGRA